MRRLLLYHDVISADLEILEDVPGVDIILVGCGTGGLAAGVGAAIKQSGPWFNIKMSSYQYMKSHCGDKTILLIYTAKMTSLYWIRALDANNVGYMESNPMEVII